MTVTYEAIATATASGSQTSITFSSIPSTFTDLVLVVQGNTSSSTTAIRFNNDTGANYSRTGLRGYTPSNANSFRQTAQQYIALDGSVTQPFENAITHIQNYTNASTYKTVLVRSNNATASGVEALAGLWYGTPAAINRVDVLSASVVNFTAGTTFSLYGIKAE
jgi:hypothetical protein